MNIDILHSTRHMRHRKIHSEKIIIIFRVVGFFLMTLSIILLIGIGIAHKKGSLQPTESKKLLKLSRTFRKNTTDTEVIKKIEFLSNALSKKHLSFLKVRSRFVSIIFVLMSIAIFLLKKSHHYTYIPEEHLLPPSEKVISKFSWYLPIMVGFLIPIIILVLTFSLPVGGK